MNGQFEPWSDPHAFKLVSALPPISDYTPSGDTNTATPLFSWPQEDTITQYELGIETQTATNWDSYTITADCQVNSFIYTKL